MEHLPDVRARLQLQWHPMPVNVPLLTIRHAHRLRQLQYHGDIIQFMTDYSNVFFGLLKNTSEWFKGSFHDASMASGYMKWVQMELE